MKTKKLKPLPLPAKPLKTIKEVKAFVIRLLRLGWCQGPYAVDANGKWIAGDANSHPACQVCLIGAIHRSTKNDRLRSTVENMVNDATPPGWPYAARFNDDPNTTLAQVIELVKKA